MIRLFATLLSLIMPALEASALPHYHTILSRTADLHGRGVYEIEQDVIFQVSPEPLTVKEVWQVAGESLMMVKFQGLGALANQISGEIFYDASSRHYSQLGAVPYSEPLPKDWWMPFFLFRYSKPMRSRLVALNMAPPESLEERKPTITRKGKLTEYSYPPQAFLRLTRTGGVVSYAVFNPGADTERAPGIWIEQDQFVVRKIRLASGVEVRADQYQRHSQDLWLPGTMQIRFDSFTAQIQTGRVRHLGTSAALAKDLSLKSFSARKSPMVLRVPESGPIREFYLRFR